MQRTVKKLASGAVSAFASLCLALALVPAAAFATTSTTGTLTLVQDSVEVSVGSSVALASLVTAEADADCHLDFVADEAASGYFTVNKHSGTLIATATTDGLETLPTVTVYLLDDEKGSGNSGKPCSGFEVLATQTITVSVAASEAGSYGYQGSGFTIYLTSPSVTGTVADGTAYTNTLEAQTVSSTVEFTFEQSAGGNQYNTYYEAWYYNSAAEAYKDLAGQYISYEDAAGDVTTVAESDAIEVTAFAFSSQIATVTISIPVGDTEGMGVLSFDADLHTFKQSDTSTVNKSLGVDISFAFEIAAADDTEGDDSDGDADGTDTDDGTTDDGTADDTTGDATDDSGTADDTTGDATDDSGTADDTTGDATDDSGTTGDTQDATDGSGTSDATDDASGDTADADDGDADVSAVTELVAANVSLAYAKTAYTGKKLTPAVTVKVNGAKLSKGADYTVSYSSNKAIGKAKVTVTGTGAYTGTVTKTFKIVPKRVTLKSATKSKAKKKLTVKWAKVAGGVTKYQVRYRVKGTSSWKSVTVKASKSSTTLKKLKSGKKYQVQVRAYKTVSGTKYCGTWSTAKTVKVK